MIGKTVRIIEPGVEGYGEKGVVFCKISTSPYHVKAYKIKLESGKLTYCREKWIRDKGRDISWDDVVDLSNQAEPFNSFINIDEPIFAQTQVDMPKAISNYCKGKGQIIPQKIGEISRCIYESLAMGIRYYLELIEKLVQKKIELIYLIGGGTQNKILCQWISNVTEVEVIAGPIESTSVGNLLMQLKGTAEIDNLEQGRQISLNSSRVVYYEPKDEDI